MNIKEIALKLQATDRFRLNVSELSAIEFAEALVAEIAKQNEPVAEVLSLFPGEPDSYINARAIGVDPFNTWTFPQPGTKLYTIQPTAEEIANETAWQPIETAPVLSNVLVARLDYGQVCWVTDARKSKVGFWSTINGRAVNEPTHWMPLPPPPKLSMEGV